MSKDNSNLSKKAIKKIALSSVSKLKFKDQPHSKQLDTQDYTKYTLCCDMLTISFTERVALDDPDRESKIFWSAERYDDKIIDAGDGYTIKQHSKYSNGTKHFKRWYEVYFDERKFAEVLAYPRSGILKTFQLSVENNVLYEGGYIHDIDNLADLCGWEFNNIARVDIAYDSRDLLKWMTKLLNKQVFRKGKGATMPMYDTDKGINKDNFTETIGNVQPYLTGNDLKLTGIDLGRRSSGKWATVYNKSEFNRTRQKKTYITDFWKKNGLIQSEKEEIHRVEVKIKNKELKKYVGNNGPGFHYRDIQDHRKLSALYIAASEGLLTLHDGTGTRSNTSKTINWCSVKPPEEMSYLKRGTTKSTSDVWLMEQTIRGLIVLSNEIHSRLTNEYILQINKIGKMYSLEDYAEKQILNYDGMIEIDNNRENIIGDRYSDVDFDK